MQIQFSGNRTSPLLAATLLVCCTLLTAGCSKDMAEQMRKDEEQAAGTTEPAAGSPAVADRSAPAANAATANTAAPAEATPASPADGEAATYAPADPAVTKHVDDETTAPIGGSPAGGQNAALQELHAVLDENIQRLKRGDAQGFLESILPPPQIAQLKQNQQLFDAVVAALKANPARMNQMTQKLEQMRQAEITLNDVNSVAEFRVPKTAAPVTGPSATRPVQFQLVNGAWRLHDHLQPAFDEISRQSKGAESVKLSAPLDGEGFGSDLPMAIDQAIATLEQGDILTFVKNMFPAAAVRHPDAESQFERIAERLKASPAPVERMIADLKALKDLEPQMESSGTVAVYVLPVPSGSSGGGSSEPFVRMYRLDGKWRMLKIGN